MKKKRLTMLNLFVILFFSLIEVHGQTTTGKDIDPLFKHSIGAGAGFTTGYGLSYRYTPARYGVQLNLAPYYNKESSSLSVGLTFLYTLIRNNISSLYLYEGNHYYYDSYTQNILNPNNPVPVLSKTTTAYFNNGVGFGIEIIIVKRIGLNLMAGYAFYKNFEELNITGETALYYKF